jgi:hypothetical protein
LQPKNDHDQQQVSSRQVAHLPEVAHDYAPQNLEIVYQIIVHYSGRFTSTGLSPIHR